jgi:hypothetical protein
MSNIVQDPSVTVPYEGLGLQPEQRKVQINAFSGDVTANRLYITTNVPNVPGFIATKPQGTPLVLHSDVAITGSLTNSGVNLPRTITVGTPQYPTIQSVFDSFAGGNAGYTNVVIPPGRYNEYVTLENFSSGGNLIVRQNPPTDMTPTSEAVRGLQILGDLRVNLCSKMYVNGFRNASQSGRGLVYNITTTGPVSGPYTAFIASSFGAIGGAGPAGIQIANPLLADSPLVTNPPTPGGFVAGNIALISRGVAGFATKTQNAQDAGAVAAIIYNNNPAGINAMGGLGASVTIPAYSISQADGAALTALINANPGIQVTVTPVDPVYYPSLGTNFSYTQLSLDPSRTQLTVTMLDTPVADQYIVGTPTIVQPDFAHPSVGLVPGDQIVLSDSDITGNYARSVHTVQSVSGNTITILPPVTAVGSGGVDVTVTGANLTFLPNVCLAPQPNPAFPLPREIFRSNGMNFGITGVCADYDASQPFAGLTNGFNFVSGNVSACGLAVTDLTGNSANEMGIHVDNGSLMLFDGNSDSAGNLSVVGWAEGVGVSDRSEIRFGNIFLSGMKQKCIGTSMSGNIGVENLQVMGSSGLYQPDAGGGIFVGGGSDYHGSIISVTNLCDVSDIYGPGIYVSGGGRMIVGNPTLALNNCYFPMEGTNQTGHGIHICTGASFEIQGGTYYASGEYYSQPGLTSSVTNCYNVWGPPYTQQNVGVYIDDGARFLNDGQIFYNGNDLNNLSIQAGQMISPFDMASPNNVYTYPSVEGIWLNPTFAQQQITGHPLVIFLDPSIMMNLDPMYIGKTYTIVAQSTPMGSHALVLLNGYFVGELVSDWDSYFVFPSIPGSQITFRVDSAEQVTVLSFTSQDIGSIYLSARNVNNETENAQLAIIAPPQQMWPYYFIGNTASVPYMGSGTALSIPLAPGESIQVYGSNNLVWAITDGVDVWFTVTVSSPDGNNVLVATGSGYFDPVTSSGSLSLSQQRLVGGDLSIVGGNSIQSVAGGRFNVTLQAFADWD